jgi:hypothetical protein
LLGGGQPESNLAAHERVPGRVADDPRTRLLHACDWLECKRRLGFIGVRRPPLSEDGAVGLLVDGALTWLCRNKYCACYSSL